MQPRVQKWGNSLGIRIPKSFAKKVGLKEGTPVDFYIEDGAIVVRPVKYDLETLLSQITPENLHEEIVIESPVGREIW
ncbi:MAG TPA: AbrB/MazE/SpoVT family DNA-binding domain-containing protein [Peptococcaceae bacterium]|nr:MAG: AbrB/SpoV-like transcription regulator [Clostridia bacterium 41_269]HBT19942.1 AbrB/MazE/SpoVT family DNA-binding domain-containing protein [Peptococcaceae bacterium]